KEQRFGLASTSLFAAATTAASCGAVNAAMESLSGIGGLVPLAQMSTGEVVFGGVGSGMYGMLMFFILGVFISGLMVGRTPEFLGKKIEAREIKLTILATVGVPIIALAGTALAIASRYGRESIYNSGPQGFGESLYAYISQANNNGSAFAGYTAYTQVDANVHVATITFSQVLGGLTMLGGRFLPMLAVLAIAGSLAGKRVAPLGAGTLRTDTPTFAVVVISVIVIVIGVVVIVVGGVEMVAVGVVDVAEQRVTVDGVADGVDEGDVVDQPVEGLRLADLRRQFGHGVVLLVEAADLLGLLAVLHRHPCVLGLEIATFDDEFLGLGHRAQCKVDLDPLLGPPPHRLHELGRVLPGSREPLPDVDALGLELLGHVLEPLVEVVVDHRLGRLDVDQRADRGGDGLGQFLAGLVQLEARQRLAEGRVPLVDGVELAEMLADPFVVEFRELHLLHGGDLDGEVGLTLGAFRRGRERQFVAGRSADELVVEVFGHPTLADLVGPVLGVQAEHLLTIAGGGDVKCDVVAGGDGPVDVDERGMLALLGGVGLGEVIVCHLDRRQLDR
ncbi:MAG TPA: potassium-transporting ATPase subunit KdpA, partial [Candidatus Saccharimonadia bacterium]|nr:potassium-transporting ATPase subunit KdpA [Candidatus Saccharimonadia bacterium]